MALEYLLKVAFGPSRSNAILIPGTDSKRIQVN
jgi:hypothetical protein